MILTSVDLELLPCKLKKLARWLLLSWGRSHQFRFFYAFCAAVLQAAVRVLPVRPSVTYKLLTR